MAYRIRRKDASVTEAVRRIAGEQIGKAIETIDDAKHAEAVHDVRKRCKKLRALVRLVRPAFAGYARENADFRDIAGLVSTARDAKVMQDTYDLLVSHYAGRIDRRALGSIRRRFTLQRKAEAGSGVAAHGLAECRTRLLDAQARLPDWTLDQDGFDALAGGIAKTYKRARKSADLAYAERSPAAFHELRKHLKYHWHHTRLMANIWPDLLDVPGSLARDLTEMLGLHHDLSVFAQRLSQDPEPYGSQASVETAMTLATHYRTKLEDKAEPMVGRLLAQTPNELVHEWRKLWSVWRGES